jgi:hypothetical protein
MTGRLRPIHQIDQMSWTCTDNAKSRLLQPQNSTSLDCGEDKCGDEKEEHHSVLRTQGLTSSSRRGLYVFASCQQGPMPDELYEFSLKFEFGWSRAIFWTADPNVQDF